MWERGDEGEEWREGSTGVSEGGKGKEKTGSVGDGGRGTYTNLFFGLRLSFGVHVPA